MGNDVILITIDCWRYDAIERMGNLREITSDYASTDCICQSASTRGTFAAILAGQYYPSVYESYSTISNETTTIFDVFKKHGYTTGGFVGSNPFLTTWAERCDDSWNDGLQTTGQSSKFEQLSAKSANVFDYLRCKSRVTTTELAERAKRWYETQNAPRFLWIHLMDIHIPFLPGFRSSLDQGLVDTYRSHLNVFRNSDDVPDKHKQTLENLYWRSVDSLDEQISRIFSFIDSSSTVIITGDHGEEFDHDDHGHARLYDECVRVPLLASKDIGDAFNSGEFVRQIDLPAILLDELNWDIPPSWGGTPANTNSENALILNHSQRHEKVYAGIRSQQYKLIKTYDESNNLLEKEAYYLVHDPEEQKDIYSNDEEVRELEQELDSFVQGFRWRDTLEESQHEREVNEAVEERLKSLGYK